MPNKNTPILLLGVAGLGLSLAMFFDTKSQKIERPGEPEEPEEQVTEVIDVVEIEEKAEDNDDNETPSLTPVQYKEMYRQNKQEAEAPRILADHSYKGNGTSFDKRLYFMKEAYRRSREQIPVDTNIALAVKLAKLRDDYYSDNDEIVE